MVTHFFEIVARVLQGDTLAPFPQLICLDYIQWTSIDLIKEIDIPVEKSRSQQYPREIITDAGYAKCLWHNLKQTSRGSSLYMNKIKHSSYVLNWNMQSPN